MPCKCDRKDNCMLITYLITEHVRVFFALPELIWLSPQFTDKRHKEINQPDPIHTWAQRGGRIEGREGKKKEKQASAT